MVTELPADLQAQAKASLRNTITSAATTNIKLEYERIQLNQAGKDRLLQPCLNGLARNRKAITGISVLKVSGDWTNNRVRDFIAQFELTAGFQALSAEAKANWNSKKTLAITGTFQPTAYVFAASYQVGEAAGN